MFDEQRYFTPGEPASQLYLIAGVRVGVSICEDAWSPTGPVSEQAAGGAELIVNINASPYFQGRLDERTRMLATRAADASCSLVYVNLVGGQDELVFDGALAGARRGRTGGGRRPRSSRSRCSIVDMEVRPAFRTRLLDPRGRRRAPSLHAGGHQRASSSDTADRRHPSTTAPLGPEDEVYEALVLGTRDYVTKNGFSDVLVGLSGGIDSSLVATIATDALGAEHVHAVAMPSRFSSEASLSDAATLAGSLGIELRTIPIEPAHASLLEMLEPSLGGTAHRV